jgi:hypothetical protein
MLRLSNGPSFGLPILAVGAGMMPESTRSRHTELCVGSSYRVGEFMSAANLLVSMRRWLSPIVV